MSTRFTVGCLLICLVVYLSLTLYQLDLPGLHYDEAFEAVPAVQILQQQPLTAFRNSTIPIFGTAFPLTTQDYIGALNTIGVIPFLAWGGINVVSLRLYAIVIGVVTLATVYGFTTTLARTPSAGLVAVSLLVVNPTFIFWSRQGIFVTAITAAIGAGAAWSWLVWWRTGRYRYALIGAFLFGLGLYAKLLFVWLIVALFVTFVVVKVRVLFLKQRPWQAIPISGAQWLGLLAAGAVGLWPLIIYNLQTGGTWLSISENADTSYYGVDNAAVIINLLARFDQFSTLLTSSHFWYLGQVQRNSIALALFVALLVVAIRLALRYKRPSLLLPYLIIVLVIGQSIVTVSNLWVTHFALIMVWPAIAIATSGVSLLQSFKHKRNGVVLAILLATLLATELGTTINYHRALQVSGGLSSHSDAIYDVADWLDQQQEKTAVAMDWGLTAPIVFLTAGRVESFEVFGYAWETTQAFDQMLQPYLEPEKTLFLWRAPDEIIFDRSGEFKALYQPLNLEETIVEAFYERSGRPILGITELVPVGSAENKPLESPSQ